MKSTARCGLASARLNRPTALANTGKPPPRTISADRVGTCCNASRAQNEQEDMVVAHLSIARETLLEHGRRRSRIWHRWQNNPEPTKQTFISKRQQEVGVPKAMRDGVSHKIRLQVPRPELRDCQRLVAGQRCGRRRNRRVSIWCVSKQAGADSVSNNERRSETHMPRSATLVMRAR